jgi:hypothetical protein
MPTHILSYIRTVHRASAVCVSQFFVTVTKYLRETILKGDRFILG